MRSLRSPALRRPTAIVASVRAAATIYRTLQGPFIDAQRTSPFELSRSVGFGNIAALWAMRPWQRMWPALGQYFRDPRLQQLFGRYATYCGSSPFSAPATLMLVAHVEQDGVWLVRGGMHEVARAWRRWPASTAPICGTGAT